MPTYDYECGACGHTFEKFQSITARPIRTCPRCGQRKVRRLLGAGAGVIFRGSGFYQTDYRSESYKKAAKDDKPSAGGKKDTDGKAADGAKSGKSAGKTPKTDNAS
jgi:putative FmdB family regulatory protein